MRSRDGGGRGGGTVWRPSRVAGGVARACLCARSRRRLGRNASDETRPVGRVETRVPAPLPPPAPASGERGEARPQRGAGRRERLTGRGRGACTGGLHGNA